MQAGKQAVLAQELKAHYDADLKSYFDTISHEKLLACLRHRIADRNVLGLTAQELKAHFQMWLEANALSTLAPVVVESDEGGTGEKMRLLLLRQRTRNEAGTPQECALNSCASGVISPLLANLFLHWFDALFHGPEGPARWADARLVRYWRKNLKAHCRRHGDSGAKMDGATYRVGGIEVGGQVRTGD